MEQSEKLPDNIRKQLMEHFNYLRFVGNDIWEVYDDENGPALRFVGYEITQLYFPEDALLKCEKCLTN
jgi:hypothetical protein